ncbi:cytochrome P450 [Fomes fomentarius]|nr:cytochrome P450 [Fomes fomentarius]
MESFSGPFISSILYLAVLTALFLSIRQYCRVRRLPWPPGPPGLPVLGNLFDIPKSQQWLQFHSLCAIYGDVVHFRVFNSSIVVLGSADVVQECLEKRSTITSDRPHSHIFELITLRTGNDFNLAFMPYGDWWRRHRRAFWQYFRPQAIAEYHAIQRAMANRFLMKVLQTPNQLKEHLRYSFSATLLKILYDIDVTDENDEWIKTVEKALEGAIESLVPGAFLVEFLPFLRHVPAFVPGAGFQKKFAEWRELSDDLKSAPVTRVKLSMERGEVAPSITARLLEGIYCTDVEGAKLAEEEEIVGNVGAVAFEVPQTFSTLETVFLAMSLYPDVLKKAHAELDAVVGPNRLPDFDDEESLVYVSAIIKEAQRWIPALPTGVPHCTTEDVELRGYIIPAGAVLIPNIWACMHDSAVFEDPETFRPERYIKDGAIDSSVRDPAAFTFGFGRRICPGRYFAEAAMFINVAAALHVFDISPPLDERGNVIRIVPKMTDGFVSHPEDCRCAIKPRSASAEALILAQTASELDSHVV